VNLACTFPFRLTCSEYQLHHRPAAVPEKSHVESAERCHCLGKQLQRSRYLPHQL